MTAGFRGPLPKPKGTLIRRNKQPELISLEGLALNVPEPSDHWNRPVIDEWYDFWDSPLATLVNRDSDLGALRRLFDYKHELALSHRAYRKERLAEGARGQRRLSPMFDAISKLEKLILPLEDRFGMSPAGRLRIGASLGEASRSLSEMNASLDDEVDGEPDDDTDPRDFLDAASTD